jgi:hypothetical protein
MTEFHRNNFDVSNFKVFGKASYIDEAVNCYISRYEKGTWETLDCFCTNRIGQCFSFAGRKDCIAVITTYKSNLGAAAALDVITLFCIFIFAVLTCCSICCPSYLGTGNNENHNQNVALQHQLEVDIGPIGTPFVYETNPQLTGLQQGPPTVRTYGQLYGQPAYGTVPADQQQRQSSALNGATKQQKVDTPISTIGSERGANYSYPVASDSANMLLHRNPSTRDSASIYVSVSDVPSTEVDARPENT